MAKTHRPSWPAYFMKIAHAAAERSTCDRKHVGCVLVLENRVIATGYNGSVPGAPHCDDVGHDMVDGHCVRTIHAEANAVLQAAKNGVATKGSFAYVNTFPCWRCFSTLVAAGVEKIFYDAEYRKDPRVERVAKELGIDLVRLDLAHDRLERSLVSLEFDR